MNRTISTGTWFIDAALHGGIPVGTIAEVFGEHMASPGHDAIIDGIIRACQLDGGTAALVNAGPDALTNSVVGRTTGCAKFSTRTCVVPETPM